jgi:tripartite-type tricarboxylate transporter receptor subunit TctC
MLCTALALGTIPASAAFPDRPIRIIVPFGAGGNADITASQMLSNSCTRRQD